MRDGRLGWRWSRFTDRQAGLVLGAAGVEHLPTQLVKQVSSLLERLLLGVPTHMSQHISVVLCSCCITCICCWAAARFSSRPAPSPAPNWSLPPLPLSKLSLSKDDDPEDLSLLE